MIREILRAGGIMMVWALAGLLVLWLPHAWAALYAVGITVLFLLVHAALPFDRGNRSRLAATRLRALPGLRRWVVAAVVLTPVWALTLAFVYNTLVYIPDDRAAELVEYAREGGWVAIVILVAIQGPIVEEFGLRGWIQGSLERRLSPSVAIAVAAFLFALLHGSGEGLLLFFGLGCIFGWAAWRSGSIWASILLHSCYNGSLILADALTEGPIPVLPNLMEREVGGGTLVVLALVCAAAVGGVVFLGAGAGSALPHPSPSTAPDRP